jgi:FkbM family methyltransferase
MFLDFAKFLNKPLPPNPTFFDVGANKGQWQDQIITLYPKCIIYAFEPIPGILPKRENVILNLYAIDLDEIDNKEFYITKDDVTSSLLVLNENVTNNFVDFMDDRGVLHRKSDFDVVKTIRVKTKRLDTFIRENSISEIHYLKIDTEGNDLNVFKSLGDESRIVWSFEMEVWNEPNTLFIDSAWRDECLEDVESYGFKLVDKFIHGKGLSSDLLFVKNQLLKRLTI